MRARAVHLLGMFSVVAAACGDDAPPPKVPPPVSAATTPPPAVSSAAMSTEVSTNTGFMRPPRFFGYFGR